MNIRKNTFKLSGLCNGKSFLSHQLKTDEKEVVNSEEHEDATCPKPEHL